MKTIGLISAICVLALSGCTTFSPDGKRAITHTYQGKSAVGFITLVDYPDEARGMITRVDQRVDKYAFRISASKFETIWTQLKEGGIEKYPSPGQFDAKTNYVIAMQDWNGVTKTFVIPKKSAPAALKKACSRIRSCAETSLSPISPYEGF